MTDATIFFELDADDMMPSADQPYTLVLAIEVNWEDSSIEWDIENGYRYPQEFGERSDRTSILYHFDLMIREITAALPWPSKWIETDQVLEVEFFEEDPDIEYPTDDQLDTLRRILAEAKRSYASRLAVAARMRPDSNADGP